MTRTLLLFAAPLALAACTASEPTPQATETGVRATPAPERSSAATPVAKPPGASEADDSEKISAATDGKDSDACGASKIQPWIGKEATVPVRKAVVAASGAKSDRWLYPDSVVTMDYNPARLNVLLEKDSDTITGARCG